MATLRFNQKKIVLNHLNNSNLDIKIELVFFCLIDVNKIVVQIISTIENPHRTVIFMVTHYPLPKDVRHKHWFINSNYLQNNILITKIFELSNLQQPIRFVIIAFFQFSG